MGPKRGSLFGPFLGHLGVPWGAWGAWDAWLSTGFLTDPTPDLPQSACGGALNDTLVRAALVVWHVACKLARIP